MNLQCHVGGKTMWILISWLLEKPADLDLHCFLIEFISGFILFLKSLIMHGISKVRAKLSSLCIIYSLEQVKFSLDKYITAI